MTDLLIPAHVQKRIDLERRAEYWAMLRRNFTIEDPRCQEWTRKLQHLSRDLYMVKAKDTVEMGVPLRPGFFHMLIMAADSPPLLTPLTNGDAYAEPGDWIFDVLARGNLRERRVRDALEREEADAQTAIEKEKRVAKENRMERVRDIVDSATKVRVSMNRDTPWSQNVAGRRKK